MLNTNIANGDVLELVLEKPSDLAEHDIEPMPFGSLVHWPSERQGDWVPGFRRGDRYYFDFPIDRDCAVNGLAVRFQLSMFEPRIYRIEMHVMYPGDHLTVWLRTNF